MNNTQIAPFLKKIIIIFFLGGVLVFYLWTTSTTYNKPFQFNFGKNLGKKNGEYRGRLEVDYYNALSDAFLAGQLHLLIKPREELLALPDPYDLNLNLPYRLHDASFYKGKYYLNFGPTPALFLFIPFRLIFQLNIPQDVAIAILGFGGLVWFVLLINYFIRIYFPDTHFWVFFIAIVCSSFCNVIPFISRRPEVYEVAIASGYFCLMAAFYWLISGVFGKQVIPWRLYLGSLFFGLAVGSRPHLIFASFFLILAWWKILKEQYHYKIKKSLKEFIGLFAPFAVCLFLLGLYNYARFDSWFDFGVRYQLAGVNIHAGKIFDPAFLLPNLYFYFIQPCFNNLRFQFPFFYLAPLYPYVLPRGYLYAESVAGVLRNMPFLNILFIFPLFYKKISQLNKYLALLIASFILTGIALALFLSFIFGSATMRYLVDFASLLLLPTILFWFFLNELFKNKKLSRFTINSIMIISIIYGCFFNIGISFTGYYDDLRRNNPGLYQAISGFFGSRNLIKNGDFESWSSGISSAPDGWTANCLIARESSIVKFNHYSARVTQELFNQSLYLNIPNYEDFKNKVVSVSVWAYGISGATPIFQIYDGVDTTYSNSGGASWEILTAIHRVNKSASQLRISLFPQVNQSNKQACFDGLIVE